MEELQCKFCGKSCKNPNSLRNHERLCPKNPDRHYVSHTIGHTAWNKGLSKKSDERLAKSAKTLSDGYKTGRLVSTKAGIPHSDEQKRKISEGRKRYLAEHPDKVPYILNHHSKGDSYPEKYFMTCFDNYLIKYEKDYRALSYFLDFAWLDSKCYIEVDGEQHYLDKDIIEHDIIRSKNLEDDGWKCLERIRWKSFKKLGLEDQKKFVQSLIKKIRDFTKF